MHRKDQALSEATWARGPRGPARAPRCAGSPAAPDRVEPGDGVLAIELAARPPLRGAGARRDDERNFSGTKAPSSGRGWPRGVLRAMLTSIASDLDRDRAPACSTLEPRTLLEAEQTHVASGFVLFSFFPGRNPERTDLGFPSAHLGLAPGERGRFLRFPPRAHGTCLVSPNPAGRARSQICTESRPTGRPRDRCGTGNPLAVGEVPGRRKRSALRAVSSRGLHCLLLSDLARARADRLLPLQDRIL